MMCKNKIFICLLLLSVVFVFSCKNEPETKYYNVYFYDDGCVLSHQTVENGKKAVRPADPQKAGYTFDNWYQDTSLTQVYDFNSPVNGDKTLYAKWNTTPLPVAEKYYAVVYYSNGATSGTAPIDSNSPYLSGSTVTVLGKGDLVHTSKSFDGWNTASDGTGTSYVAGQTFVISSNTILYAKWSGKNPSPSVPVIPSASKRCATSETSNDASISDVDETMEYSIDGGTTWIPVTGTQITGLSAGIVKVRVKETDTTLAGEITDVDLRCENTSVPSALALEYVAPTTIDGNDGKITGVSTAMEYSTDNGTTWTACTGTEITGLSAGNVQIRYAATDKKKASTPTTVTVEDKVTITFNGNGATGSMTPVLIQKGTSYTLPASTFTAPSAKSFSKWKVDGSTTEYSVGESFIVASNITLVAQWSDKANGPAAPTGITRSISPSNTSAADGVISGVNTTMEYSTDNGTNWSDCTGTTITGLKAGKVKIRVKETATNLAGDVTEFYLKVESSEISAPTGLTPTPPVTAGGSDGKITGVSTAMEYSTDGGTTWNPCGTEITGLSAGTVKVRLKETDTTDAGQIAEVVVKARYSISFAAGDHGSSTMTAASAVAGESYTVPECGFTANTGYEFNIWNDGTNDVTVGSVITVNSNITLTAKWNPKTYTITYKDKGNVAFSGEHETGYPTTHTYGTATTLKTATKTGYVFCGWFTSSDCSGSVVTSLGATDITADTTLYAKWTIAAVFSVSSNKTVAFSLGNIQYQASTDTWRFAEHQYDYIGNAAGNTTEMPDRSSQSAWIDLFGWGATGKSTAGLAPYEVEHDNHIYKPTSEPFVFGDVLSVSNGSEWGCCFGGTDSHWRTLSLNEWEYLLIRRYFTGIGMGEGRSYQRIWIKIDDTKTVFGLLIYPDGYTNQRPRKYEGPFETITKETFEEMEAAGCVFLPSAGVRVQYYRVVDTYLDMSNYGFYWSWTSRVSDGQGEGLAISSDGSVDYTGCAIRYIGASVRLVYEIE